MSKNEYLPRLIDEKVTKYLEAFGAVCIEGPKWCGKTETSLHHSKSVFYVGSPAGNFSNRKLAQMDPSLVLKGDTPRLIDEWQEVPLLWDAVRFASDESKKKGQFILTGSSTPNRKGVVHSGAGRIARLRMRPMSLFEMGFSTGDISLQGLFCNIYPSVLTGEIDLGKIIRHIVRGGWPGSLDIDDSLASLLPEQYLDAIITNDINRVDERKRDITKMQLLLRSLARNESTTVSNNTLKKDIKVNDDTDIHEDTISDYLSVFERLFLLDNQKPYGPHFRSSLRVKQAEKRHFSDPSLACALMGATEESLLGDMETLGFLFEALCERDLKIYAEANDAKLFHYQDYHDNEIDAVIEMKDGTWGAFEIKLGAHQIDDAAVNLLRMKSLMESNPKAKPPKVVCVICGLSNAAYLREDGVYVVPITALTK